MDIQKRTVYCDKINKDVKIVYEDNGVLDNRVYRKNNIECKICPKEECKVFNGALHEFPYGYKYE